jgi:bacteriocin-like protein
VGRGIRTLSDDELDAVTGGTFCDVIGHIAKAELPTAIEAVFPSV